MSEIYMFSYISFMTSITFRLGVNTDTFSSENEILYIWDYIFRILKVDCIFHLLKPIFTYCIIEQTIILSLKYSLWYSDVSILA